ncbi:MAG: ABC transporter substrate-binding protein [Janthinobacterium lividum]
MNWKKAALLLLTILSVGQTSARPLIVCTEASPDGFDPVRYSTLTITNASADVVFDGLVAYDTATGKIAPALAQSWDVDASGMIYTFHLRHNVPFQTTRYFKPGRTFDADDVVATFDRMTNPENPWRKAQPGVVLPSVLSQQIPSLVRSVEKVDASTVRITLSRPDAAFLATLSMGFASIYSAEYMAQLLKRAPDAGAALNAQPVGTGPFVFQGYLRDATVRYAANPAYWGGKPGVQGLIYAITPDSGVRRQKVLAGECDIALAPAPEDVAAARKAPALKVLEVPGFMTSFVAVNTQRPGLDNVLVRRAINLAFDRDGYVRTVFRGSAAAALAPYPGKNVVATAYGYDPAQARKYLAQAGRGKGLSLTIWTRSKGSTLNPAPEVGAQLLQADLVKVGIDAHIKTLEWGELLHEIKQGQYDLLFMGWAGDNGDPDNFMSPLFSCAAIQGGTNFQRVCDSALDSEITQGKSRSSTVKRAQAYASALARVRDQAAWIALAHPSVSALVRNGVSGYRVSPFGRVDFSKVTVR